MDHILENTKNLLALCIILIAIPLIGYTQEQKERLEASEVATALKGEECKPGPKEAILIVRSGPFRLLEPIIVVMSIEPSFTPDRYGSERVPTERPSVLTMLISTKIRCAKVRAGGIYEVRIQSTYETYGTGYYWSSVHFRPQEGRIYMPRLEIDDPDKRSGRVWIEEYHTRRVVSRADPNALIVE